METPADLQKNLKYCLLHFKETSANRTRLASELGVNVSTISRWLNFESKPHHSHIRKIAQLCALPLELFHAAHQTFVEEINKLDAHRILFMDYSNVDRRIVLGCTEKWKHHIDECFEQHAGSYFMYTRLLSEPTGAAISLLRIIEKTEHGIAFDIHNVDTRVPPGSQPVIYRYAGLMFPVNECLSFYGEEQSGNEPLSMITSSAQVRARSILAGYFTAVAVHGATRMPTGTKVALAYRSAKMLVPEKILSNLGVVSLESLPKEMRQLI